MAKPELQIEARKLRKEGTGIKTIAYRLHVSSSTVSIWCKDIPLTHEQVKELERRCHDPYYGQRLLYLQKIQKEKTEKKEKLFIKSKKEVGIKTNRDLFIAGIALYWAEGFKKDNQVGFSNSDPTMIHLWIDWLEQCVGESINTLRFRLGINEHCKDRYDAIEKFWCEELHVRNNQFQKPFFQKVQWKKIYEHPEEYHGVLRIRVRKSSQLLTKIKGWIAGLSNTQEI